MKKKRTPEPKCPYCGAHVEHLPDPDGSCDDYCTVCTWHQHIPSDDEIAQAKREQNDALESRRP